MSATLAVKPTRREILKAVLDAAKAKKVAEQQAADREWRQLHDAARKANDKVQEIARTYANKKYKGLLAKIKKLVLAEFPEGVVNFTVDLEKVNNSTRGGGSRESFLPDGKASVRLVVYNAEKTETDLPPEVRAEMTAAQEESLRLYAEANRKYDEVQRLSKMAGEYGHYDGTAYQKLLERVVPALGDEAAGHLDALIGMVQKALEVPVNPAPTA